MGGNVEPSFSNSNDENIFVHENHFEITKKCCKHFLYCDANTDVMAIGCGASIDIFIVGSFENNNKIIFPFEVYCGEKTLRFTSSFSPTIELDEEVYG